MEKWADHLELVSNFLLVEYNDCWKKVHQFSQQQKSCRFFAWLWCSFLIQFAFIRSQSFPGRYADRIGNSAAIYLAGVLEYLTGELVDLAGETCKDYKMKRILPRHILTTIKLDEELSTLLKDVTFFHGGFVGSLFLGHLSKATEARMQLSQGVQSTVENEQGHIDEDEHLDGDTEGEEEQNDSDDEEVEMS